MNYGFALCILLQHCLFNNCLPDIVSFKYETKVPVLDIVSFKYETNVPALDIVSSKYETNVPVPDIVSFKLN
jgi:hypothetical protein